jgi:hypothetical protein
MVQTQKAFQHLTLGLQKFKNSLKQHQDKTRASTIEK